jgi:hypothetical protein
LVEAALTRSVTPALRLLNSMPLTARRILHVGCADGALARAYRRRNPQAVFVGEPEPIDVDAVAPHGPFDLAILPAALPPHIATLLMRLDSVLDSDATILAPVPASTTTSAGDLFAAAGFQVRRVEQPTADHDALGDYGLVCLQKSAQARSRRLHLRVGAFVPTFLDVRARLPAHALRSDPCLSVEYQEAPVSLPVASPDSPKLLLMQRPRLPDVAAWRNAAAACISHGWIMAVEVDDHPELVAQVDRRTTTDLDWLRFGYCHAVQTSTEPLRAAISPYNPEVRIFRNAVFDLPPFSGAARPPRVFCGALGRRPFSVRVAASLGEAIRAVPELEFVVVGEREVFDALPTSRKTHHGHVPYQQYLDLIASCAVALAPLEGLPFQDCKSDVKFLEAARGGVLTIASPTVYGGTIVDGVNGLIAREMGDWARLLAAALADPGRRTAMARAAWEYVRDERMFAYQVAERRTWYLDLWDRREELNAQLIARLPGLAQQLGG